MADYIEITDSEVDPEAPLRSSLGFRWRDNPIAIAQGAAGAPRVVSAAIDWGTVSGEIGRGQLKTASGSVSETVEGTGTSSGLNILPGGRYAFAPQFSSTNSTSDSASSSGVALFGVPEGQYSGSGTENLQQETWVYLEKVKDGGSGTDSTIAHSLYIQSSPPYDHGDGVVEGYVYAKLQGSGGVSGLYLAEDPPWYGNTQHAPIEQWREDGKEYQRTRRLKCCKRDVDEGRISMAEFIERAGECEDVVEEITPETKLRGMEDLPHPFGGRDDRAIILIDPMDPLTGRLIRMMQAGESVHELFGDGYLIVGGEIKRAGPPGVPVHTVRWRKT